MAYPIGASVELARTWSIQKLIGKGGLGSVYEATSKQGEPYALKLIPKDPGADRELLFGDDLSTATNVVPIIDKGQWQDYYVLVMPRAKISLRAHLNEIDNCDPLDAIQILIDIAEALLSLDGMVVHRDIKPDNILLLNDRWQLADFGISKYADATTAQDTRKFARTPIYAAPEQWRDEPTSSATDIYALGIVGYELIAGQPPFYSEEISAIRHLHLHEIPPIIKDVQTTLPDIVNQCLFKSPQARPTPEGLLQQLRNALELASVAGSSLLQEANTAAVTQQAEKSLRESIARSEEHRRQELFEAAEQSYKPIAASLEMKITQYASQASKRELDGKTEWRLNTATLIMIRIPSFERTPDPDRSPYQIPFDVIAYAAISVIGKKDAYRGYSGRSHSLWYCDAKSKGEYRWFEVAFMNNLVGQPDIVPFHLDPSEAGMAFGRGISSRRCARAFVAIDRDNVSEFVNRWLEWFGQGATDKLAYPGILPEDPPQGSWRQG